MKFKCNYLLIIIDFILLELYDHLAERKMLIYPGKLTYLDTFRLGSIGDLHPKDCEKIMKHIKDFLIESKVKLPVSYDWV